MTVVEEHNGVILEFCGVSKVCALLLDPKLEPKVDFFSPGFAMTSTIMTGSSKNTIGRRS